MALKIFSISKNDWAGCGYFLSEAINSCTEHHSRSIRRESSKYGFPYDLTNLTGQRFRRLWDWADVVHVHDMPGEDVSKLPPKPTVITYHGTKYRQSPTGYIRIALKRKWLLTVATPDLTQFGLPWLPDCRPDFFDNHDPADEFTVCHAPSKREVKGTERVIEACKKVGVKLDLIEDTDWEMCMERKSKCHLLIDQFELGYGCNAIEAWSLGMPVIADGTPEVMHALEYMSTAIPFLRPVPMLEDAIARMRDDISARGYWEVRGRKQYRDFHSPFSAAQIAVKFYEEAIKKERDRHKESMVPPPAIPVGPVVLVHYVGGNYAVQHWFPPSGNKSYKFSKSDPTRYVFKKDVPWFLEQKDKRERALFEVVKDGV